MGDDVAFTIDDAGLTIREIRVGFLHHAHHRLRRESLREKVQRARVVRANIHGLGFADADIGAHAFVATTAGD
jgi:hypothetical protein